MSPRWQRLKRIVGDALERPPEEREAYLDAACGEDGELRREAASLLDLEASSAILDQPPVSQVERAVPLPPGTRLGPWRILEPLGSGGMGEVYLGERADGTFEQQVAVKVIRARGALGGELLARFLSERQLLAELGHSNIAHLVDGGTLADGRPYLVMEYVPGEPIDRHCARRELPVEARLRLFLQVCDAVQHAHQHLVIHRDLKPANVLVTPEGVVKLLDFGGAKDLGQAGKTPETRLLRPLTPEYASPEQLLGGAVTTTSDIYSLGVILYELLTGESPFGEGRDPLAGRAHTAPPSRPSTRVSRSGGRQLRRLRRRLAGDLDHIVLMALAPDPGQRYPSVEALARDLERHLAGLPLENHPGSLYRLGKWAGRHWKGLTAAAVVLALAAGLVAEALQSRAMERESRQLQRETERVTRLSNDLGNYLIRLFLQADPGRTGERNQTLEAMLDHGAQMLVPEAFADEPLLRAALLGAMGQVYRRQDLSDQAEPLLRESLELRRAALPPDHEDISLAGNNLANALRGLGRYPEARELLEEALRIRRLHHPDDDPETAAMLSNLAGVEKELGLFHESIGHFHQSLEMKRRLPDHFGPEALATAIKNWGTALETAGRWDEAEAAFRQALAELDTVEAPNPLTGASIQHRLASLLRQRGDLSRAWTLLQPVYETRLRLRGDAHRQTLETLLELALLDQGEGHLAEAEEALRRVVELRRRNLGDHHPDLAEALIPLARVQAQRGEVADAVLAAEEGLAILRQALPPGHERITEGEELLGDLQRHPVTSAAP